MNKKTLSFLAVLIFMTVVKHAFGQDGPEIGWDQVSDDPTQDIAAVMVAGPILGVFFGAFRLLTANSAPPVLLSLRLR